MGKMVYHHVKIERNCSISLDFSLFLNKKFSLILLPELEPLNNLPYQFSTLPPELKAAFFTVVLSGDQNCDSSTSSRQKLP